MPAVVLAAVAQNGYALEYAAPELQTIGRAALLADATKVRAGGRLVAALQRLAAAAGFADDGHFALTSGGLHSQDLLASCLAGVPADLFELVHQSLAMHEVPALGLIGRASEHGWAWRSAMGLELGLPSRAEVRHIAFDADLDISCLRLQNEPWSWQLMTAAAAGTR